MKKPANSGGDSNNRLAKNHKNYAAPSVLMNETIDHTPAFITALTGSPDTIMNWRVIHDRDKGAPAHNFTGTFDQVRDTLTAYNASGYGVFCNINEFDGKGQTLANVVACRAQMVDLDGVDAAQQYELAVASGASFAVQSSANKWHVYWLTIPYVGNDVYANIQRKLFTKFNGDKSVVDAARVPRAAGFYHMKGEPKLVEFIPLSGARYDMGALQTWLADVDVFDHSGIRNDLGDPEKAAPSLDTLKLALSCLNPNNLDRNEWLSITAAFKQAGWSHADEATLLDHWLKWCATYDKDNPAENAKLWNSIRDTEVGWSTFLHITPINAYMQFGVAPLENSKKPKGFYFTRVDELPDVKQNFLVDKIIPEHSLSMIFGASGVGKTFVVISLGVCIAAGISWFGHKAEKGSVLYICGEGKSGIRKRLLAFAALKDIPLKGLEFYVSSGAADFSDPESILQVREAIESLHIQPALIIIDTLSRNNGKDENDSAAMAAFFKALDNLKDEYRASILLVHHTGHSDKERARGSSVIKAVLDAEFRVEKSNDQMTFTCTKMKDAPEPPRMNFQLQSVPIVVYDFPEMAAGLVRTKDEPLEVLLSPQNHHALTILKEVCGAEGIKKDTLQNLFAKRKVIDSELSDSVRSISQRILRKLIKQNLVSIKDDRVFLSDNADKVRTSHGQVQTTDEQPMPCKGQTGQPP